MGFTFNEFPWTKYYDSDLREVLKYMKEFASKLEEFQKVADKLLAIVNTEFPQLESRVTALENATSDIATIRQNLATAISNLSALTSKEQADVDALWAEVNRVASLMDSWQSDLAAIYTYVDSRLAVIRSDLETDLYMLKVALNKVNIELTDRIDKLSERVEYLIRHLATDVYNPVTHQRMSFDDNNKAVYVDLRDYGMTYGELAARQYTNKYIIDAEWRQRHYSTKGRRDVTHGATWLHSPLSGRWTSWAEALSHAIGWIVGSLTYAGLNAKQLTYLDLEELELTYADLILLDAAGGGGGGSQEPVYMSGALVVDGTGEPLTYGKLDRTVVTL